MNIQERKHSLKSYSRRYVTVTRRVTFYRMLKRCGSGGRSFHDRHSTEKIETKLGCYNCPSLASDFRIFVPSAKKY